MPQQLNPIELKVLKRELDLQELRKKEAQANDIPNAGSNTVSSVIDDFISQCDDPNYFRTIFDKVTGQKVVLTDEEIDVVNRIRRAVYPDPNYDPYEPYVDFFTNEVSIHPVMNRPEPKAAFIPSLSEKRALTKLVALITSGKLKPHNPKSRQRNPYAFNTDLWKVEGDINARRHRAHIAAPKMALPGHAESYNPPPEYLLTKDDIKKWESQSEEERESFYLPQRFSSLREVPFYQNIIRERFDRCLELYMCPRQRRRRANVDPEDLIPKLPRPKDLAPFPSTEAIVYKGHGDMVRSVTVEPQGQFFASASDDCCMKIWELLNGRCWSTVKFESQVSLVSWCPSTRVTLIAVAVGKSVYIFNSLVGDISVVNDTDEMFRQELNQNENGKKNDDDKVEEENDSDDNEYDSDSVDSDGSKEIKRRDRGKDKQPAKWISIDEKDKLFEYGARLRIDFAHDVEQFTWHPRGDYFSVVMPNARNLSVIIGHLNNRQAQYPFKRGKHLFQRIAFHPTKPQVFAADDRNVLVYDLSKKLLIKKLSTGMKTTSCIAVHPKGDNLLVGSYDPRLAWFDTDLSTKPYKTMRYHKGAIRCADFHKKYPLFASGSDDSHVIVSHGMVYDDLSENALIVPLKMLHGHEHAHTHAVTDCKFHKSLPWLLSSGADKTIRLFA